MLDRTAIVAMQLVNTVDSLDEIRRRLAMAERIGHKLVQEANRKFIVPPFFLRLRLAFFRCRFAKRRQVAQLKHRGLIVKRTFAFHAIDPNRRLGFLCFSSQCLVVDFNADVSFTLCHIKAAPLIGQERAKLKLMRNRSFRRTFNFQIASGSCSDLHFDELTDRRWRTVQARDHAIFIRRSWINLPVGVDRSTMVAAFQQKGALIGIGLCQVTLASSCATVIAFDKQLKLLLIIQAQIFVGCSLLDPSHLFVVVVDISLGFRVSSLWLRLLHLNLLARSIDPIEGDYHDRFRRSKVVIKVVAGKLLVVANRVVAFRDIVRWQ